jgi:hypothetical protein
LFFVCLSDPNFFFFLFPAQLMECLILMRRY